MEEFVKTEPLKMERLYYFSQYRHFGVDDTEESQVTPCWKVVMYKESGKYAFPFGIHYESEGDENGDGR